MPAVEESLLNTRKSLIDAILTNDKIDEDKKSELIANMISEFKAEYPELKYHATKQDVTETELRLTKEIENTRKEIKELDLKLTKEIENTRKEIKEVDAKLTKEIKELDLKFTKEIEKTRKEIKEVDAKLTKEIKELDLKFTKEIEKTRKEIKETKISMIKWSFMFWVSQMGALIGIGFLILKAMK